MRVTIGGAVRTGGPQVVTFEVAEGGVVTELETGGGTEATGAGSRPTDVRGHVPAIGAVTAAQS